MDWQTVGDVVIVLTGIVFVWFFGYTLLFMRRNTISSEEE